MYTAATTFVKPSWFLRQNHVTTKLFPYSGMVFAAQPTEEAKMAMGLVWCPLGPLMVFLRLLVKLGDP